MVAFKRQHAIAVPLHIVCATLESSSCDEQFVPWQHQLTSDLPCHRVNEKAICVLLERHHPSWLRLVRSEYIVDALVDEVRVHQLWLQEQRHSFLECFRGHDFQLAIIQCPSESELSVGALCQLTRTLWHSATRRPKSVEALCKHWQLNKEENGIYDDCFL